MSFQEIAAGQRRLALLNCFQRDRDFAVQVIGPQLQKGFDVSLLPFLRRLPRGGQAAVGKYPRAIFDKDWRPGAMAKDVVALLKALLQIGFKKRRDFDRVVADLVDGLAQNFRPGVSKKLANTVRAIQIAAVAVGKDDILLASQFEMVMVSNCATR